MYKIENPEMYMAAVLGRLSNERLEDVKKYGESGSIRNQISLLKQFCKENHIRIYDTYVDDGESGAFYDRPRFYQNDWGHWSRSR